MKLLTYNSYDHNKTPGTSESHRTIRVTRTMKTLGSIITITITGGVSTRESTRIGTAQMNSTK